MSTNYPLSQLDHHITLLRDRLDGLSRDAELLSGQELRLKSAEIEKWATELEALVGERKALSRDAT